MTHGIDFNRRQWIQSMGAAGLLGAAGFEALAQDRPLNIGMVSPLTGVAAAYGTEYAEGARAYVKAWNARGGYKGRPVGFTLLDDESTSVGSLSAFKKLATTPDTSIIWLASASSAILAVKPVTDEFA
ncbi:MAG: ABC transporter substrate-binding protein, partial [Rubrivivax sp.]